MGVMKTNTKATSAKSGATRVSDSVETTTVRPRVGGKIPQDDMEEDDFVDQCRGQARVLGERKLDQEQRLGALVESSFGQLEQVFNALLQATQENHAVHHAQFEEASALLEENLDHHEQVETKLRAIMAILTGGFSQQ